MFPNRKHTRMSISDLLPHKQKYTKTIYYLAHKRYTMPKAIVSK